MHIRDGDDPSTFKEFEPAQHVSGPDGSVLPWSANHQKADALTP
jgi:hypothetical protein